MRAENLSEPSAISHGMPMALGTALLSLVRSKVVARLEQRCCQILYTLVPKTFPLQKSEKLERPVFPGVETLVLSQNFFGKNRSFR